MPYNQKGTYYIEGEWGGKVCTKCGWFMNWWEFSKKKGGFKGVFSKCKRCEREYYSTHIDRILINKKEYNIKKADEIRVKRKQYYIDHKDDIIETCRERNKYPALFNTYGNQLTIEEQPRETEEGYLEVKCANSECREYFIPTNLQVVSRTQALKGQTEGESRLYCSEKCKHECSLYGQKKYPKGFKPETLDTEFPAFVKEEIFKRDKYKCQICGRTHDLQAHHEFPGSTHHMLSKDVKNGITLCKECHIKVHSLPGCSFKEISACSRKIKKDLKQKGINLNEVPDWAINKYLKPSQPPTIREKPND